MLNVKKRTKTICELASSVNREVNMITCSAIFEMFG